MLSPRSRERSRTPVEPSAPAATTTMRAAQASALLREGIVASEEVYEISAIVSLLDVVHFDLGEQVGSTRFGDGQVACIQRVLRAYIAPGNTVTTIDARLLVYAPGVNAILEINHDIVQAELRIADAGCTLAQRLHFADLETLWMRSGAERLVGPIVVPLQVSRVAQITDRLRPSRIIEYFEIRLDRAIGVDQRRTPET